jgi:hypothetical protein
MPPGTILRYNDRFDPHGGTAAWILRSTGVHLVSWRARPPDAGDYVWIGLADVVRAPPCDIHAFDGAIYPARTAGLVDVRDGATVRIGLARCRLSGDIEK